MLHRQRHAARAEFATKIPGTSEWVTLTRLQGMMPLYGLLDVGSGWWVFVTFEIGAGRYRFTLRDARLAVSAPARDGRA